jgi:glutamate 5-kinase
MKELFYFVFGEVNDEGFFKMTKNQVIGFIGAGSMTEALLRGIVQTGVVEAKNILLVNRENRARVEKLVEVWGVAAVSKEELVEKADILFLAVKPKDVAQVMCELGPKLKQEQILISVAAGIPTSFLEGFCNEKVQVIRAMPNTSCTVLASATGISRGSFAGEEALRVTEKLFSAVGIVEIVEEERQNLITGLSGSGPAYVYYMVEALEQAGTKLGLPEESALQLATQTVYGAAKMLMETGEKARDLRAKVSSPGGTTLAGLKAMSEYGFQEAVFAGVQAASIRAKEMGLEFTGMNAVDLPKNSNPLIEHAVKRVVIKVGSSTLNHANGGLCHASLVKLVAEIARLRELGLEIVVVSSGAVAAGMGILGLKTRPKAIKERQAAAAVGQGYLIQRYNEELSRFGLNSAQILLTRLDLADRDRYQNARNTLETLLQNGIIPIVNENDTVAIEELCFGDNDRLSAMVAGLVDAQLLVIFSDVDGLYTDNPRGNAQAELISRVTDITTETFELASGKGSQLGTGGMSSKLNAGKIANSFGIGMLILNGSKPEQLKEFLEGTARGTYFFPEQNKLPSRKRWLAWGGISEGTIQVDEGARCAILWEGKSLLPKGVLRVEGTWERGDLVRIVDKKQREIARGLVTLSSAELERCKGMHTEEVAKIIGVRDRSCEVIHRNYLSITR